MSAKKIKMLYLMHVSWNWIKQRPHFLAENLATSFDVRVFFIQSFFNKISSVKFINLFFAKPLYSLPLQRFLKYKFYYSLSEKFFVIQLKNQIKEVKYVWITSPNLFSIVRNELNDSHIVIYDCMDDFLEFPNVRINEIIYNRSLLNERELFSRANIIFSSSLFLKEKLVNRFFYKSNIFIVNNGISDIFFKEKIVSHNVYKFDKEFFFDLYYIGTISSWFDFDLILQSLEKFNEIRYVLIGPTDVPIPNHERIIYLGKKEHHQLLEFMKKADALLMPFVVNDLVRAVNPVKLYEYIYVGKPILTCKYDEIDKFNQFVYQYNSTIEFNLFLKKILKNELIVESEENRLSFLKDNTWEVRSNHVLNILNSFI
jgi:teichuronic acid biosynthesis glycosyltransferase TuaH